MPQMGGVKSYLQMANDHLKLEEKSIFISIFIIDSQEGLLDARNEEELLDDGIHVTSSTGIFQTNKIASSSTLDGWFILFYTIINVNHDTKLLS